MVHLLKEVRNPRNMFGLQSRTMQFTDRDQAPRSRNNIIYYIIAHFGKKLSSKRA